MNHIVLINFKGDSAAVSQSVPNHGDMDAMRSIVRNAGTPEGKNILNASVIEPRAFVNGKASSQEQKSLTQEPLMNISPELEAKNTGSKTVAQFGPAVSPPNIAADVVSTNKKGGSLFETLKVIATRVGPPVALLAAATYAQRKKGSTRKTRKRCRKSTRRRRHR